MKISCGVAPGRDLIEVARTAERLGYERIWLYDSPALYQDLWISLARIAEATTLGLGTAVAVPGLRHVMVTAAAIATIEEIAPGRLNCAFGTGFSGRMALGKRPLAWAAVRRYVEDLRGLLRGDVARVDGVACQMLHSPHYGPRRPIETPLLIAADGPKGQAIAREVADGLLCTGAPPADCEHWVLPTFGAVLEPGESEVTPRVVETVGPFWTYGVHAAWEVGQGLEHFPGHEAWLERIEAARPEGERHLAVHEGHVVEVSERDRPLVEAAGAQLLELGWTGDAASIRERLAQAAASGARELIYSACGRDIASELERFARAIGLREGRAELT